MAVGICLSKSFPIILYEGDFKVAISPTTSYWEIMMPLRLCTNDYKPARIGGFEKNIMILIQLRPIRFRPFIGFVSAKRYRISLHKLKLSNFAIIFALKIAGSCPMTATTKAFIFTQR